MGMRPPKPPPPGNDSFKDGKDGDGAAVGVDVRWSENAEMNGWNGREVKVGLVGLSGVDCDGLGLGGVVDAGKPEEGVGDVERRIESR